MNGVRVSLSGSGHRHAAVQASMELFMTVKDASLAPMIAVIGCDGSGKSTVSEKIVVWASDYGPAATAHLGKQAGNVGRKLTNLPLVGKFIGRFIGHKNFSLREPRAKNKTPGILAALVASMFIYFKCAALIICTQVLFWRIPVQDLVSPLMQSIMALNLAFVSETRSVIT